MGLTASTPAVSFAAPASTCSQLSSTSSAGSSPSSTASWRSTIAPGTSPAEIDVSTARPTDWSSTVADRSTQNTPPGYRPPASQATAIASRVLPMPPGPCERHETLPGEHGGDRGEVRRPADQPGDRCWNVVSGPHRSIMHPPIGGCRRRAVVHARPGSGEERAMLKRVLLGVVAVSVLSAPTPVSAESGWSVAEPVAELNSAAADGCPIESPNGREFYLASTRPGWSRRQRHLGGPPAKQPRSVEHARTPRGTRQQHRQRLLPDPVAGLLAVVRVRATGPEAPATPDRALATST